MVSEVMMSASSTKFPKVVEYFSSKHVTTRHLEEDVYVWDAGVLVVFSVVCFGVLGDFWVLGV